MTIGAGVQWLDVYEMAHQQNRSIAGGFVVNGSVGAGAGWPHRDCAKELVVVVMVLASRRLCLCR